jgi:hypothetical protein
MECLISPLNAKTLLPLMVILLRGMVLMVLICREKENTVGWCCRVGDGVD